MKDAGRADRHDAVIAHAEGRQGGQWSVLQTPRADIQ